jgi:hypothetical protein
MDLFETAQKMYKGSDNWIMDHVIASQAWGSKNATRPSQLYKDRGRSKGVTENKVQVVFYSCQKMSHTFGTGSTL